MLDPYRTLQIPQDASQEDIKGAYRKLAKQLHPDLHPHDASAAKRFHDVTAAYDTLSDVAKRRHYDRQAGIGIKRRMAGGSERDEGMDIFRRAWNFRTKQEEATQGSQESNFANGGAEPSQKPRDLYQTVQISFAEAALGAKRRVTLGDRLVDITIPPLTEDGRTLRLKGQGGGVTSLPGSARGDAFILINVQPHPFFSRKGNDIYLTLPVSVPEAVLGASITVPTLHGMVQVKIPAGSNSDTTLRLRGKGLQPMAATNAPSGDQFIVLKIILPDGKNTEFTDLVADWSAQHRYEARPSGWQDL